MTSTLFGLEVWLGPMEGHRYVGPGVNGVVRVGRVEKDKNRGAQNQFVISKGLGISASHAELRMDRGRVFVRDLGSTNGTFADQKRLSGEVEIEPGSMILFSFTPVRVDLLEEMPTTSMVIDAVVASDFGDANLEILLDAARKAAEARKESFLDTRHLADAVLRSRNPWLQKVLRDAGWAREDALAELWEAALFQEPEKWLAEVLMRPVELKAAANDFLVAPKVATFLRAAVRRLKNVQDDPETALRRELLGFLVADERGAVGTWLKAHGLQVPSALAPSEEEVLGGGPRRSWEEDDLKETHLEKRRFPVPPTEVPGIDAEGEPPPRRGFVSQRMPSVAPDAGPKTTLAPPRRPSAEEPA
ncbi:MAG: FHA domain-containing protein, partial [Acidobacteria bacterium]|nr:FHA domain-containing protein [Acidobacteriota bacterium]